MRRAISCFALTLTVYSAPAAAQGAPVDTVGRLAPVGALLERLGPTLGPDIWPGFRPDTIPVVFVLRGRGSVLVNWPGAPPEGFAPLAGVPLVAWRPEAARGAASTNAAIGGRTVAQVVVGRLVTEELLGIAVHEAFHAYERAAARDDRSFGRAENAFLVTSYPVFDADNEAGVALEGRLLAAALREGDARRTRELARQFLAAREARHRRLGPQLAEFECNTELNEGLAEYSLWRARSAAASGTGVDSVAARLDSLVGNPAQSIRLRAYATGPAIALLLDRLAPGWKDRLMSGTPTLQDVLADSTGYRAAESALREHAYREQGGDALVRRAAASVAALRRLRRAQVDSVLDRPGILLVLATDGLGGVGLCGLDPQNLLQVDRGVLLHTRWVRPCAGSALQAEFTTPVVQDDSSLRAVIGAEGEVRITVGGRAIVVGERRQGVEQLEIASPVVTMRAAQADIEQQGRVLRVRPRR
ncbi:MAG: hypothetical protein ACREMV_10110 [Gemmatimonadales bacterium]